MSMITGSKGNARMDKKTDESRQITRSDPGPRIALRVARGILSIFLGVLGYDSVAAQTIFSNPEPLAIADGDNQGPGTGDAYPSQIEVSGLEGVIDNLTVTLHGFSHTWPDDLALMLVAPDNTHMVILSDAGGDRDAVDVKLSLSDAAAQRVPSTFGFVTGTFRPSSYGDDDTFPLVGDMPPPADCQPNDSGECRQAEPAGTSTLNGTFGGLAPNGTWSLYAIDCCAGDTGSITGGWSIALETRPEGNPDPPPEFYNPTPIVIADSIDISGIGDPYPSQIEVTGVTGVITNVAVTIHEFTHTYPEDLALLLVAPDNTFMVLHSDAGGGANVTEVTFTLSDAAPAGAPDSGPLLPGLYRPTSIGDDDTFPLSGAMPPPADCQPDNSGECPQPAPAGSATLNEIFSGLSPNGTWSLYAIDCCFDDRGSITAGWSIEFQTTSGDIIFFNGFE
jgi:subtilisin-like proprotein convertase family protein